MTLIISAVAITGITIVNSRYGGDFLVGLVVIVVPFLALSFSLPYLLPVRCPRCGARMHFRFGKRGTDARDVYWYACESCADRHEWEGASSAATLDN